LPLIDSVTFNANAGSRGELTINGKSFRKDETQVSVNGVQLKKLSLESPDSQSGTFTRILCDDPKIRKKLPAGQAVDIVVAIPRTGQSSPAFQFKRE